MCVCVCALLYESTHTSRHDQYPCSAGLPELPVCSGQWSPGLSPVAGLCLRKKYYGRAEHFVD